ncbi:hypothetical protein B0H34DRAFT_798603 [Crassisporium funariophilum]|nr:hypothetical protein B0H34DRAFT_798603 [Crassisporium funariophilum]
MSQQHNNPLQSHGQSHHLSSSNSPTTRARKITFAKGVFDVFLALSLMFFPSLLYDGPITYMISKVTGLATPNWDKDPSAAFGLGSLIMGCALAGIKAGQTDSEEAHKTVAALNGGFALTGLLVTLFAPHRYRSSFLLLASLQDVFWSSAIMRAGGYGFADTMGLTSPSITHLEERVGRQVRQGKETFQDKKRELREKDQGGYLGEPERATTQN